MVEVGTYATRSEAELAQAALVAAGVTSRLLADDAGGAYPFDLTGGARLLVDEADVELAAGILGTGGPGRVPVSPMNASLEVAGRRLAV
jgi:hypothetical protein